MEQPVNYRHKRDEDKIVIIVFTVFLSIHY